MACLVDSRVKANDVQVVVGMEARSVKSLYSLVLSASSSLASVGPWLGPWMFLLGRCRIAKCSLDNNLPYYFVNR